ncbi:mutator type transposase [Tanacetum coccineum]
MSKAFRAKAKAKERLKEITFCSILCLDYVVELQSTNPNTTVKITVERNTYPSLPTRVFQRIYICLGALKLGFRACRKDLLGLDGAFMKGIPGQDCVGLDSNNEIYPFAYVLVEAKSKSLWCWFLQCLVDDIDLYPNSNFTFISDRQKGIVPAIKTLWRAASATNVRDFEKGMLELKTMNPKAHEWLNKIPAEHWASLIFQVEPNLIYCSTTFVRRQSLEELLAKHQGESTRRGTEMEVWIKKLQENSEINTRNLSASLKNLETQTKQLTKEIHSNKTPNSSSGQIKIVTANQETVVLNKLHGVSFISETESNTPDALQHQLPSKELNPGSFTLPCMIG